MMQRRLRNLSLFKSNSTVTDACLDLVSVFLDCRVTSIDMSDDSSLLCAGFADSTIRVLTTSSHKLRSMKTAAELDNIDRDAG